MTNLKTVLFAGISLMMPAFAQAQDCAELAKNNLFDVSYESSDKAKAESFRTVFCQQNLKSAGEAREFGASLGIPGDLGMTNFGFNGGDASFEKNYASYCSDEAYSSNSREKTVAFVRKASPVIANLVEACLVGGLNARVVPVSWEYFKVKLTFRSSSGKLHFAEDVTLTVKGAKCDEVPKKIDASGHTVSCERAATDQAVMLTLNSDMVVRWQGPSMLPPRPPAPAPCVAKAINIDAVRFVQSNRWVSVAHGRTSVYKNTIGNFVDPSNNHKNWAEWKVPMACSGRYRLMVEYAAQSPRSVSVLVNGAMAMPSALNSKTKSWTDVKWFTVGELDLNRGDNAVRFSRSLPFPHIRTLRFVPVS